MKSIEGGTPYLLGTNPVDTGDFAYLDLSTTQEDECSASCVACYASWGGTAVADRIYYQKEAFLTISQWEQVIDNMARGKIQTILFSGIGDVTSSKEWPVQKKLIAHACDTFSNVIIYSNGLDMDWEMAEGISRVPNLAVIGKWYHPDPSRNDLLLGLERKNPQLAKQYALYDGEFIPKHLAMLMEMGMTDDFRLGVQCTITKHNAPNIPRMWKWLREHRIVPTFSWIVPTGLGKMAAAKIDLTETEKLALTKECWEIDQEMGIIWEFGLGPHIEATFCDDHNMVYIGPIGDFRMCSSDRGKPYSFVDEKTSYEDILAAKRQSNQMLAAQRQQIAGKPTCICAHCATNPL